MSANLEVTGLDELLNRLNQINQDTEEKFKDTLKEIAEDMLADMKNTTAFNDVSGNLRRSLDITEIEGSGTNINIRVGANYKKKGNHAHLVEFGTSKMKAKPFIGPIYANKKREIIEKIKQALREAIGE